MSRIAKFTIILIVSLSINIVLFVSISHLSVVRSYRKKRIDSAGHIDTLEEKNPLPKQSAIPGIAIRVPDSNTSWYEGLTCKIEWSSRGISNGVNIDLFKGNNLIEILAESTENDGDFYLHVGTTNYPKGADYRIRVSDSLDPRIEDYSSFFKINYPKLMVLYPRSAITLKIGERCEIAWILLGNIDQVSIELYKETEIVEYIAPSIDNTGQYEWNVDGYEPSTEYCVCIRDFNDPNVFDRCLPFKIVNPELLPVLFTAAIITLVCALSVAMMLHIYIVRDELARLGFF